MSDVVDDVAVDRPLSITFILTCVLLRCAVALFLTFFLDSAVDRSYFSCGKE